MAKKEKRFPYEIRREAVSKGIYESIIETEVTKKELCRTPGEVIKIDELAQNVHLLTMQGSQENYFIILFGEKVYTFSKNMKYTISYNNRTISIVDKNVTSKICY